MKATDILYISLLIFYVYHNFTTNHWIHSFLNWTITIFYWIALLVLLPFLFCFANFFLIYFQSNLFFLSFLHVSYHLRLFFYSIILFLFVNVKFLILIHFQIYFYRELFAIIFLLIFSCFLRYLQSINYLIDKNSRTFLHLFCYDVSLLPIYYILSKLYLIMQNQTHHHGCLYIVTLLIFHIVSFCRRYLLHHSLNHRYSK